MIHFAFMLIDVYLLCIFILKFWEGHYVRVYVNNFGKSGQYSSFMRFSQSFDIHSSLNWWWQWCQRLSKSWTSIILGIRKQSIFSFHWLLSRVEFITYHVQLQNFSSSIQSIAPFLMEKTPLLMKNVAGTLRKGISKYGNFHRNWKISKTRNKLIICIWKYVKILLGTYNQNP